MLQPRRVKHRKQHRGRRAGAAGAGNYIAFGEFGLQAQGAAWIDSRHIESARRAMTHEMKRGGKVWIRIFPDKPVTTKGLEVPMGGGKGGVDHYVAIVRPGTIVFEMDGVPLEAAREAMRLASHKMPFRSRFITKHD